MRALISFSYLPSHSGDSGRASGSRQTPLDCRASGHTRVGLPRQIGSPDRLPAWEAEGQVVWTCHSPQVRGGRLASFLVSFMFAYLRPSPPTTGLRAGFIDHNDRSWTVILNP